MAKTFRPKDARLTALAGLMIAIALGVLVLRLLPQRGTAFSPPKLTPMPGIGFDALRSDENVRHAPEIMPTPERPTEETNPVLKEANRLIQAKQHEAAIELMTGARNELAAFPRAYDLMGQALLARPDPAAARDFFQAAINRDPMYADAYFGFARASETLGDIESALGGMRGFLHLVKDKDPFRLRVAQARSAIWEWEAQLGRGPWGPTKGIPPGFTAEEIRRDGRGVGVKIQKPESMRADGSTEAEMKHQSKFKIFQRD